MRIVEFHPEAEAELISAAQYYEEQAENLGSDFLSAVERSCRRLIEFPESGHPFGRHLRRSLVPAFPYALLHRVDGERILVVVVAHLHRRRAIGALASERVICRLETADRLVRSNLVAACRLPRGRLR